MSRRVSFAVLVGLASLSMLVSAAPPASAAPDNPPRARGGLEGALAPPFSASHIAGPDSAQLADLRGRVVVLDFWATWCGPCAMVRPLLDSLHQQYHGQGLTVLGISNEPRPIIQNHLLSHPVGYTVARDRGPTSTSYGVSAIPTLVIIDRHGKVRRVYAGLSRTGLREMVGLVPQLLAEPGPPPAP